jgi:hypothetical protein
MSTNKSVLHSDRNLIITLVTDESGDPPPLLTIQSTKNGPDLSFSDDVIVVANAEALEVDFEDRAHVSASLAKLGDLRGQLLQLHVRIGEFFGGWEIEIEEEE